MSEICLWIQRQNGVRPGNDLTAELHLSDLLPRRNASFRLKSKGHPALYFPGRCVLAFVIGDLFLNTAPSANTVSGRAWFARAGGRKRATSRYRLGGDVVVDHMRSSGSWLLLDSSASVAGK